MGLGDGLGAIRENFSFTRMTRFKGVPLHEAKENTEFAQEDAKDAKTDQDGVGGGLGAIQELPR